MCSLLSRMGENCCVALCVPQSLSLMRTKARGTFRIKVYIISEFEMGSISNIANIANAFLKEKFVLFIILNNNNSVTFHLSMLHVNFLQGY